MRITSAFPGSFYSAIDAGREGRAGYTGDHASALEYLLYTRPILREQAVVAAQVRPRSIANATVLSLQGGELLEDSAPIVNSGYLHDGSTAATNIVPDSQLPGLLPHHAILSSEAGASGSCAMSCGKARRRRAATRSATRSTTPRSAARARPSRRSCSTSSTTEESRECNCPPSFAHAPGALPVRDGIASCRADQSRLRPIDADPRRVPHRSGAATWRFHRRLQRARRERRLARAHLGRRLQPHGHIARRRMGRHDGEPRTSGPVRATGARTPIALARRIVASTFTPFAPTGIHQRSRCLLQRDRCGARGTRRLCAGACERAGDLLYTRPILGEQMVVTPQVNGRNIIDATSLWMENGDLVESGKPTSTTPTSTIPRRQRPTSCPMPVYPACWRHGRSCRAKQGHREPVPCPAIAPHRRAVFR